MQFWVPQEEGMAARRKTGRARRQVEAALQEVAEGAALLRGVLVNAVAVQEVHGHVQRVLHVRLKAKVGFPDEWQRARAVRVHVGPHVTAPAQVACRARAARAPQRPMAWRYAWPSWPPSVRAAQGSRAGDTHRRCRQLSIPYPYM